MPSYILIKAVDGFNPDDPMTYNTGYPVYVYGQSTIGGVLVPPKWIQVEVTDWDDFEALKTYIEEWRTEIDWEFVSHDWVNDTHSLDVFTRADLVSASGLNRLTRDKVENFLNRWNATVNGFSEGRVRFTAGVADALMSQGLWGFPIPAGTMIELDGYDYPTTEYHTIGVDYSTYPLEADMLQDIATNNGLSITWHNASKKQAKFICHRNVLFDAFKRDVKDAVSSLGSFSRRKWKIPQQYVQTALDSGGTLSVTRQQLATYIYSRLLD